MKCQVILLADSLKCGGSLIDDDEELDAIITVRRGSCVRCYL
jgi:hypothetical protein